MVLWYSYADVVSTEMHFDNYSNVLKDGCNGKYLQFYCIRLRLKCHSRCSSIFDEGTYTSNVVYAALMGVATSMPPYGVDWRSGKA